MSNPKTAPKSSSFLIIFEGGDGTGKTTHVKKLSNALLWKGIKHTTRRGPDRASATGRVLDRFLKGGFPEWSKETAQYLFVANMWEAQPALKKDLKEHQVVVCDRYVGSALAYGAASGMDMENLYTAYQGCVAPNLVFALHRPVDVRMGPENAAKILEEGGEVYDTTAFQKKVDQQYERAYALLLVKYPGVKVVFLDTRRSEKEIHTRIMNHVELLWKEEKGAQT